MNELVVQPRHDCRLRELALFAGVGGGILAGKLLGWRTVCAVELDAYAASILVARQNDGFLEPFPICHDVRIFNGRQWRGYVDVVSGGFPCQDISAIKRGATGIAGSRSGLWREMARIIAESRPRFVFIENSPLLLSRGLHDVLRDLAEMGYDAKWGIIGADDAGFPHQRKRIWIVGVAQRARLEGHSGHEPKAQGSSGIGTSRSIAEAGLCFAGWKQVVYSSDCDADGNCPVCGYDYADCGCIGPTMEECQYGVFSGSIYGRPRLRFIEPELGRVARGTANRVDRIRAIGNIQVPSVARLAWRILTAP